MTATEQRNKALVPKAFDTLFNKRDYAAAQGLWSSDYPQHGAHIEPGRKGLSGLVKAAELGKITPHRGNAPTPGREETLLAAARGPQGREHQITLK